MTIEDLIEKYEMLKRNATTLNAMHKAKSGIDSKAYTAFIQSNTGIIKDLKELETRYKPKALNIANVSKSVCGHPKNKVWQYNNKTYCDNCKTWLSFEQADC